MADLTLERIAELRALVEKLRAFHGTSDLAGFAKLSAEIAVAFRMNAMPLLDAAERGLTGDRKAAAFDALCEIAKAMGEVRIGYSLSCWSAYWYDDSSLVDGDDRSKINTERIEDECPVAAVEALAFKLHEPTDGQ